VLAILSLIVAAAPAAAQIPDEFTNLKVLPEDIGKRELVDIMKAFSGALGVRCSFCHVGESTTSLEGFDFASDEKEAKEVARAMMKMVGDINDNHLAQLGHDGDVPRVRCVTCHHGVQEPQTIDNVVLAVAGKDGLDAAMTRYRELRGEYYGTAAYDFTAGPLNTVAETLARQHNDVAGAIKVMKMNLEFNPDSAMSHLLLAQLYQASGDKAAALASAQKSLELDPQNKWAQKMLEQLKAAE
jgi:tetratricopeptide (TPR) repeat protein